MSSHFSSYFIGMGALGASFAAKILKHHPREIQIIAKGERAERLRSGITVNGEHFPLTIVDAPNKKADLIIIAVKYPQLEEAIQDIKPFVGDKTLIISILNGLYSETRLSEVFGAHKVIPAFGIAMDCSKNGNEIYFKNLGRIVFGDEFNIEKSSRVLRVEEFFKRNEIPYEIPDDMNRAIWFKFMLNAGVNQVSSLLRAPFKEFHSNTHAREMMVQVAREVLALAEKKQIDLRNSDIELLVKTINALDPEGKTSMLQDLEARRETEVDYFSGEIIKMGKALKVATPINEFLLHAIKYQEDINKRS